MTTAPKIPDGYVMTILIQNIPKDPGEKALWEGMTRQEIQHAMYKTPFRSATINSKIRKMARRGLVQVCECGEHVRPTQQGVDSARAEVERGTARATRMSDRDREQIMGVKPDPPDLLEQLKQSLTDAKAGHND